jgi:hypothetical protein
MSDGTTYELCDNCDWDLHFELQGGDSPADAPALEASFIRWMNVERQQVAKRNSYIIAAI